MENKQVKPLPKKEPLKQHMPVKKPIGEGCCKDEKMGKKC